MVRRAGHPGRITVMPQNRFTTASVVGTGMMGPGIALMRALGGIRVTLLSRTVEGAAQGMEKAREQGRGLPANQLRRTAEVERALERLDGSTDFDRSVAGAALVVESGPEDLAWQQDLFGRMGGLARPEAVLASNTSGLSITAIAGRCTRPERVLTTHFWNPPHLMPLVEIVQGGKTSTEVVREVRDLLAGCGRPGSRRAWNPARRSAQRRRRGASSTLPGRSLPGLRRRRSRSPVARAGLRLR